MALSENFPPFETIDKKLFEQKLIFYCHWLVRKDYDFKGVSLTKDYEQNYELDGFNFEGLTLSYFDYTIGE